MADAGQFQPIIDAAATKYGIDPSWLSRLLYQENGFRPQGTSPAGAQGIAQFMPAAAKRYGVDVNDPNSSIQGAAHYLSDNLKLFGGNQGLATAAYNWGEGNVQKWLQAGGEVPAETQNYVSSITGRPIADWRGAGGTGSRLAVAAPPPGTTTINTTGPAAPSGAPTTTAGGPSAPAAPGQPGQPPGGLAGSLPGFTPNSPGAKMTAAGLQTLGGGQGAGGGGGSGSQPPQPPPPMQLDARATGGGMMMGAGGQNMYPRALAQQALGQQGFMTQPSFAAYGGNAMPSPIGAPSPGGGVAPGSAQGIPSMPGTTLNSPSQLQMALMSGSINPYDMYARNAGGLGSS